MRNLPRDTASGEREDRMLFHDRLNANTQHRKKDGGPTLNWFLLQQTLCNASGDVLVILDCCHAALKTRGEKEGKMEVLAACGSGSRVPAPGRLSFTSVLIRQIRKRLNSGDDLNVKWLHNHLWADKTEPGLTGSFENSAQKRSS